MLGLGGRFTDELLSELPAVLMPSIRARLGLSLAQVGVLYQVLATLAAVVEPINGLAIDVSDRRRLLAGGAFGLGLASMLIGLSPGFGLLIVAFAVIGLGSGPLAHTADVVLIDGHPDAVDAISTRSAQIDTVGALLAPASVATAFWAGIDGRALLVAAGFITLIYALALARTPFPRAERATARVLPQMRANLAAVARDGQARRWLGVLFFEELANVPALFAPLWLRDVVGMSQGLVAVHVATGLAASLAGAFLLERWLRDRDGLRVVSLSLLASAVLYPLWLFAPGGVVTRFVLVVPLYLAVAAIWPIVHGRALASAPGRAGAVTAVSALFGLLPAAPIFGVAAGTIGLATTMLVTHLVATAGMLILIGRRGVRAGG